MSQHQRHAVARPQAQGSVVRALARVLAVGATLAWFAMAPAAAEVQPESVVRDAVDTISVALNENAVDPERLREAVERAVAPRLDPAYTAQVALGPHWRKATPEERERVATSLQRMVLGGLTAALERQPRARIDFLATRLNDAADDATVLTRVHPTSGPPIELGFRLQQREGAWKFYDLVIEGVSMLTTYRRSFTTRVNRVGLAAFIEELERKY